jgi:peroxiredoxin Q/BCP
MADITMPAVGSFAPDFTLPDQEGSMHTLSAQKGHWVLVYFYPKDDTPGCTMQACAIRDDYPMFEKLNATVFGISADSIKSHGKFVEKYHLPFTVLSDEEKKTLTAYGVWQKKSFLGKSYMGILRTSFLVDPKGKIAKIYEKVKPADHADAVLRDLKEFTVSGGSA